MYKFKGRVIITSVVGVVVIIGLATGIIGSSVSRAAPNGALLTGTITSASGEKMEGVTVSARADGMTFTTSVFTGADGGYYFPRMDEGHYKVWAQAVGYLAGRAEVNLTGTVQHQPFALKPTKDFSAQLSGDRYMAALPEDDAQDRKMKEVFRNTCGGCHAQNFPLQNRFDEQGWEKVITLMSKEGAFGYTGDNKEPNPVMAHYKKELAAYLAKMRGPGQSPLRFSPRPRPTGDQTLAVVKEYDTYMPGYEAPLFLNDGSDWSLGAPDKMDKPTGHPINATVDFNGNLWFSNQIKYPFGNRTVGEIDTKTGKVKNFKLAGPDGIAYESHDIETDDEGRIWFNTSNRSLGEIDPSTEKIEEFITPKGMSGVGGFISHDGHGNMWCTTSTGALRFDPKSKKWTEYKSVTQKSSMGPAGGYGIAGDRNGNGWWSQYAIDTEARADGETGKSGEVHFPARVNKAADLFTGEDRKIFESEGGGEFNGRGIPWEQGPRKPGGDLNGDVVWVPLWFGQQLAEINIRTLAVTLHPYPIFDGGAYSVSVDNDHMVWVNFQYADAVAKFDPKAKKWTTYYLPTLGTDNHGVQVTEHNGPTQAAVAEWSTGKVALLQFRTKEQMQALVAEVQQMARAR